MLYEKYSDSTANPVDGFYDVLQLAWESISGQYDIIASMPDSRCIFEDIAPQKPCLAAETIVRNMLLCVTQLVDRFSPWYKRPARAFGLVSYRDMITHRTKWRLAPEALKKWNMQIEMMATEFEQKSGLVDAIVLVSGLDILDEKPTDTLVATCECDPPKEILVPRSFLNAHPIVCKECQEAFIVHQS